MAGCRSRACAGICSTRSAPRPNRPSIKSIPDFNRGDNEGICAFHVNQKRGRRWSAATRLSQAGAQPLQSAARNRLPGRRHRVRRQARGRRALAAKAAKRMRALPRRSHPRGRLDRLDANPAVVRRRAGAAFARAWHSDVVPDRPGVGANLQDHLQLRLIYKVDGITHAQRALSCALGLAGMLAEYALFRRGPLTMAPSQLGLFTRSDPDQDARQSAVSRPAAVARPFRRAAAHFPGFHRERRQSAADQPRICAIALARSRRCAGASNPIISPPMRTAASRRLRIRLTRRIVAQPALAPFHPDEYLPGPRARRR